ncbi:hypothetical protein ACIO6U_15170 [Streptomyces sp. NPDC087422]
MRLPSQRIQNLERRRVRALPGRSTSGGRPGRNAAGETAWPEV